MKALLVIDVQNDFMPGGALAVDGGDEIVSVINQIEPEFQLVIATQDWHPDNHISFAANHQDKKPFDTIEIDGITQTLWPKHCIQGSSGADFHPDLNTQVIEAIFRKGVSKEIDSYSGFFDNARLKATGLAGYLHTREVRTLYFSGLAADVCVYYSILDALELGFDCILIEDATKALNEDVFDDMRVQLKNRGVRFTLSEQIKNGE